MFPLLGAATASPVLRFSEATTRTPVALVGVMHYNTHSVHIVRNTIASEPFLRAVCLELCDERWNATVASHSRRGVLERWLFEDECQAAHDEAAQAKSGIKVLLADQPIQTTFSRLRELMDSSCSDVLSLAGWCRIAHDVRAGVEDVLVLGEPSEAAPQGLSALDVPLLLLNAPLAVLRYLLSSPLATTLLAGALVTLDLLLDAISVDESVIEFPERLAEVGLVFAVVMVALRIALVALVMERNDALAENIRRAATNARAANGSGGGEGSSGASVVAVLGLVHIRGVRRRLLEAGGTASNATKSQRAPAAPSQAADRLLENDIADRPLMLIPRRSVVSTALVGMLTSTAAVAVPEAPALAPAAAPNVPAGLAELAATLEAAQQLVDDGAFDELARLLSRPVMKSFLGFEPPDADTRPPAALLAAFPVPSRAEATSSLTALMRSLSDLDTVCRRAGQRPAAQPPSMRANDAALVAREQLDAARYHLTEVIARYYGPTRSDGSIACVSCAGDWGDGNFLPNLSPGS